jgi:transposase-like protein
VTTDGGREVLGLDVGDSEDGGFWTAFLRSLKARGLASVQLVISDAHTGLKQAIGAVMAGASWQRCRVHFLRINRPWGRRQASVAVSACCLRRRRWPSMSAMTRAWRATSVCQPRAWASSRSARMSVSWFSRAGRNSVVVTKLSHCSQMLA